MARLTPLVLAAVVTHGAACGGQAFDLPSASMMPTLHVGDRIVVRGLEADEPVRGDVVVFLYDAADGPAAGGLSRDRGGPDPLSGEHFVMRVIGLPGDRLRVEDDTITIAGIVVETKRQGPTTCATFMGGDYDATPNASCPCELQRETIGARTWVAQRMLGDCRRGASATWPERSARMYDRYLGAANTNPDWPDVVVPAGHVLLFGDNRQASRDSRFIGFVPLRRIVGKAVEVESNRHDPERERLTLE